MVATPEEIRITAEALQKRIISTSASVQDAVAKLWEQYANEGWLTGVDRPGSGGTADQFIAEAARIIDAGATNVAQTGDLWLANLADVPPGTLDYDEIVSGIRKGTTTEEVLARSIKRARVLHFAGQSNAEALAGGKTRALGVAGTNVPYAMRQTAQAFGIAHGVAGWRRRPNPGACMFCMMASTQRYRTGALMPMHTNCHCVPMPILGTSDPGRVIDKQGLALLKQAKKDGTKVAVNEHGELGPMLGKAGDTFTSEDELANANL